MGRTGAGFTTKELSKRTFPDFEALFSQGNGWDFCQCMAYQRGGNLPRKLARTRAEQATYNNREKRALVEDGRAHGILVYSAGEPVGWCQFGPADEFPLPEHRRKDTTPPPSAGNRKLWRITCFVTHKDHQGRGVSKIALGAALDAIRNKGGGLVEARPIAHLPTDPDLIQLIRDHGPGSRKVRQHLETTTGGKDVDVYDNKPFCVAGVPIEGVGPVTGYFVRYVDMFHCGTVSMFQREGFRAVATRGRRVVMHKTVRGRAPGTKKPSGNLRQTQRGRSTENI